jgi:hypothetical protein
MARMSAATLRRPDIASRCSGHAFPFGAPGRLDELVAELTDENRHDET